MQGIYQKGMTLIELTVVLLILIALAGLAIPYVGGTSQMALCKATDASMHAIKTAIMGGGANTGFYMDTLGSFPKKTKGPTTADYSLHFLFTRTDSEWNDYNPKTAVGWRGPYLMQGRSLDATVLNALDASFDDASKVHTKNKKYDGVDADTTETVTEAEKLFHVMDTWNRPIIIQVPLSCAYSTNPNGCARLVSAGPGNGITASDASINATIGSSDASDRGDDRVLFLKIADPYPEGNRPCDE